MNHKRILFVIFLHIFCYPSFSQPLSSTDSTDYDTLQITPRYSKVDFILDTTNNLELYNFILDWEKTPYKFGGNTKNGIDCSRFCAQVFKNVYNRDLFFTARAMYAQCKKISVDSLREGDLIFFKIHKNYISHVGIYLKDKKFAHATVHEGVTISDLDDAYYKKYFAGAGRVPVNSSAK